MCVLITRRQKEISKLLPAFGIGHKLCNRDHLATTDLHVHLLEGPVRSLPVAVGYQALPSIALFGKVHLGPGELLMSGSRLEKMTDYANVFKRANQRLSGIEEHMSENPLLQWSEVALGTAGILSNVYSLYYNFKRKGFPRQLYIVLNFIDLSVCIVGVVSFNYLNVFLFFLYVMANQASGIWTCIIGGARLLAMSRPFYQINKRLFWAISTVLLTIGTIPLVIVTFCTRIIGIYYFMVIFGCAIGIVLINLVLTVWTGILLTRKSDVAAQRDQQRRNAAVTVVLLGVVFPLTNTSGAVLWGLWLNDYGRDILCHTIARGNGTAAHTVMTCSFIKHVSGTFSGNMWRAMWLCDAKFSVTKSKTQGFVLYCLSHI
eukprot:sb/3465759/